MLTSTQLLRSAVLPFVFVFVSVNYCDAQNAAPSVTPELAHRIEAMLRSKVELPPATSIRFGKRSESEIPGYELLEVRLSTLGGDNREMPLSVSKDGTKIAQFTKYDIDADPKTKFQTGDRPSRGGPVNAPVLIVSYDDLECPYCAHLHAELFPALLERYKNEVRIVYRSFPLEGHSWAMRAAIDTDCLGRESAQAYWAAVDKIHARATEYGGTEHSLAKAQAEIDAEVREQGHAFHVNEGGLDACMVRQDDRAEKSSVRLGEQLGVDSTPTLFINGLKVDGVVPLEFLFEVIDDALRVEGRTPPVKGGADSN